jgi:multidrug efflux pump subunit AcrB
MIQLLWNKSIRTHEEHPEEPTTVLVQKTIRYLLTMVGPSLCTIIYFLPFALMSGVTGAYFKVLTDTMIITLVLFLFCNLDSITCCLFICLLKRKYFSEIKINQRAAQS